MNKTELLLNEIILKLKRDINALESENKKLRSDRKKLKAKLEDAYEDIEILEDELDGWYNKGVIRVRVPWLV